MKLRVLLIFISLMSIFFSNACSEPEVPVGQPMDFPGNEATTGSTGLQFTVPDGWVEEKPASQMRKTQFRLPGDGTEDAELAVFAGIGGSVQQNVDRWINQFSAPGGGSVKDDAKIENRNVNGINTTIVDVIGDFKSGGMGPMARGGSEVKSNYRMLAAVLETKTGPWFLKLTGPLETVNSWEDSFNRYVESARIGN